MSKSNLPIFSSRGFMVSGLKLKCLMHFKLIFVYDVRECSNLIQLHVDVQISALHIEEAIFFSIVYSCLFWCRLIDHVGMD